MFLEIITPDKKIFEGEVESVTLPGSDGIFQILENHAPFASTLGKGNIKYIQKKQKKVITAVEGGVIEVIHNKVSVLVESITDELETKK